MGQSLAGAGVGLTSKYLGKGISSIGGNSKLSKALGAGVSTFAGTVGGTAVSNLLSNGKVGNLLGKAGAINPYGLAG